MATQGYYTDDKEENPIAGTRPGISDNFRDQQRNRNGWGVSNVEVKGDTSARRVSERAFEYGGRQMANVGKRLKEQARTRELSGKNDQITNSLNKVGERINKMGRIARASSRGFAFRKGEVSAAAARVQVGFTMGWTGFLNVLSLPIGILALAAFGGTVVVSTAEEYVGETVVDVVTSVTAWVMGANDFNIWVLAIGLYVLHAFLIITMFAGSYIQLKIGGIQPLHGRAAAMKNLTFLGAFLISAIPGTTFVPWIFGWLLVVMIYPN